MRSILTGNAIIIFVTAVLGFWVQSMDGLAGANIAEKIGVSRVFWPLVMPAFGALIMMLIYVTRKEDIEENFAEGRIQKFNIRLAVALMFGPILALFVQCSFAMIHFDMVNKRSALTGLTLISLSYFAVMGNYASALRPGSKGGLRTPWTLQCEKVWHKTHRLLGRGLLLASIAGFAILFVMPSAPVLYMHIATIIAVKISAILYSFACWRSLSNQHT